MAGDSIRMGASAGTRSSWRRGATSRVAAATPQAAGRNEVGRSVRPLIRRRRTDAGDAREARLRQTSIEIAGGRGEPDTGMTS